MLQKKRRSWESIKRSNYWRQQHMHHIISSMNENTEENFCGKIVLIFSSLSFAWNLNSHMMPFMWPIVCVLNENFMLKTFVFNFPIHVENKKCFKQIIYACKETYWKVLKTHRILFHSLSSFIWWEATVKFPFVECQK